jgi:glycosyltransferase involved in cell wall biosynthesis
MTRIDGIETQVNLQKRIDALNIDIAREYNNVLEHVRRIKVFSHELSNTGAPFVLADIIDQWIEREDYPKEAIEFILLNDARDNKTLKESLDRKGVSFKSVNSANLSFKKGDIVVMNTIAYPEWLFNLVLQNARDGRIGHIFIYSHEYAIDKNMIAHSTKELLMSTLAEKRATIYVSNLLTLHKYREFLDADENIVLMPNRFDIDKEEFASKDERDFEQIEFISAGTADIRKGQLDIIYAYLSFYNNYYRGNESKYRDFRITIVGIDNTYPHLALYLERIYAAAKGLDDHVRLIGYVSLDELKILMQESNISVLYSLYECLPRSIFDGMAYGHPLIRNDCGGVDEQLIAGVNGWKVQIEDWQGLVETIEEILNKAKTSNAKLSDMSRASVSVAKEFSDIKYRIIDDVMEKYKSPVKHNRFTI